MGTHKPHSARQRPPPPTPTNMESYRHSNDQVADDKSNVLAAVSTFFMTQSGAKDAKTPTVAEAKLTFTDLNLPLMAALTAKQTKIAASTAAKYVGLIKVLKTKAKKDIKDKTTLTTEEEKTKIADFDKMDEAAKAAKETEFATEQKAIEEAHAATMKSFKATIKAMKTAMKDTTEEKAKESLSLEQAAALLKAAKLHKGTFVFNADKSIDFFVQGEDTKDATKDAVQFQLGWIESAQNMLPSKETAQKAGFYGGIVSAILGLVAYFKDTILKTVGVSTPAVESGMSMMSIALIVMLVAVVGALALHMSTDGGIGEIFPEF